MDGGRSAYVGQGQTRPGRFSQQAVHRLSRIVEVPPEMSRSVLAGHLHREASDAGPVRAQATAGVPHILESCPAKVTITDRLPRSRN